MHHPKRGWGNVQIDAQPVLEAVAAQWLSVRDRAVLAGVGMTPTALELMVVEGALGVAVEAPPANLLVVLEEHVDFPVSSPQIHSLDLPGTFDA